MSTPNYTILIIEDEKNISDFMSKALKSNGYRVITAVSGNSGLSLVSSQCPDIILLDLGLPDLDGNNVITSVRQWTSSPIIVISARTGEKDKVTALDLGADDYITKPFGTLELLARIRASLRHSNRMDSNSALYIRPYQCQGLLLDFDKRMLTLNGEEIHLTQIEYKIVAFLARNSGPGLRAAQHVPRIRRTGCQLFPNARLHEPAKRGRGTPPGCGGRRAYRADGNLFAEIFLD